VNARGENKPVEPALVGSLAVTEATEATTRRDGTPSSTPSARLDPREIAHPALLVVVALACVAVLVARFVVPSPLWLDEALSVNIARLPLGRIPGALRHDGHPPLFYFLLHAWMSLFGEGDRAVRALSGVISLAALPLAYLAGRRIAGPRAGWMSVIALSLSPYFLRYGSETRMYSMLMCLALAGYLVTTNALETPRVGWLIGVAAITTALLWTHYWSMWLLFSIGLLLLGRLVWRWRREHRVDRAAVLVLVAMAVGALTYVPWIPTLLYQAAHTGTPWAKPFRPSTLMMGSLTDFNGGPYSEPQTLMLYTVVLMTIGVFGRGVDDWRIDLDLRTRREARLPAAVLATTVGVSSLIGIATHSTFASRYAAVFFPFFILLVALGLDHVTGPVTRNLALGLFLVLSLVGVGVVFTDSRSQSRDVVDAMRAQHVAGAVVVTCPDQLGPSVDREVAGRWPVVAYPTMGSPKRVDWVDYQQRNRHNDPVAFARRLEALAGNRTIFVAMNNTYRTFDNQCAHLVGELGATRTVRPLVQGTDKFYEPISLYMVSPPAT
jgi:hypothetical protein